MLVRSIADASTAFLNLMVDFLPGRLVYKQLVHWMVGRLVG